MESLFAGYIGLCTKYEKLAFISALFGGEILASSTLISPGGILFKHCYERHMERFLKRLVTKTN